MNVNEAKRVRQDQIVGDPSSLPPLRKIVMVVSQFSREYSIYTNPLLT